MEHRDPLENEILEDEREESSFQFFGTPEEIVTQYTHCSLCNSNLHFIHITNFAKNITRESTQCLECGVKAHRLIHRLH